MKIRKRSSLARWLALEWVSIRKFFSRRERHALASQIIQRTRFESLNRRVIDLQNQLTHAGQEMVLMLEAKDLEIERVMLVTEFKCLVTQDLDPESIIVSSVEFFAGVVKGSSVIIFGRTFKDEDVFYTAKHHNFDGYSVDTLLFIEDTLCDKIGPRMVHDPYVRQFSADPDFFRWAGIEHPCFEDGTSIACFSCFGTKGCQAVVLIYREQPYTHHELKIMSDVQSIIGKHIEKLDRIWNVQRNGWPSAPAEIEKDSDYDDEDDD